MNDSFPNGLTTNSDGHFLITSVAELKDLATYVNAGNDCAGLTFKLGADIDLKELANFTPIGNDKNPFSGTFDGDNHTLSRLKIEDKRGSHKGLFGFNCGTIANVKLTDVKLHGKDNVGGFAGRNDGSIVGCFFSGEASGKFNVGGIAGYNRGTIERCQSVCSLKGSNKVGGIVGTGYGIARDKSPGKVSDCCAVIKTIAATNKDGTCGGLLGINPRPCSASGWYFSKNSSINGVGGGLSGDISKIYRLILPKRIKATSGDSIDIDGTTYYKNGSTVTLSGSFVEGDKIRISGIGSDLALDGNTITAQGLTIALELSLPDDDYTWTQIENDSATCKRVSFRIMASGRSIVCAADEEEKILFTVSGINSTNGIKVAGKVVTVPEENRVGEVQSATTIIRLPKPTPRPPKPTPHPPKLTPRPKPIQRRLSTILSSRLRTALT